MNLLKFGILGGDLRYKYIYDMLKKDGFEVKIFKNKFIEDCVETLEDLLKEIDILICPVPFSKDNENIFISEYEQIPFENFLNKLKNFDIKLLAGGVIPKNFEKMCKNFNIKTFDFFNENSIAIFNAVPTAEGAIQSAMEESHKTIFGSKSLVLGYGRCGKILANSLSGLNSDVTVTYRKDEDNAYINCYGMSSLNISKLKENIQNFDFIFNTIPDCILNAEILKKVNKESVIIDLAQAPGGVDYNFARKLNLKAIYCPALPGRVAPYSAGEILKVAILKYCKNYI